MKKKQSIAYKTWKAFRDGLVIHLLLLVLGGVFAALQIWIPAAAAGAAWLGTMLFLRDPERVPQETEGVILASADGRILALEQGSDPDFQGSVHRVMIFMSPLDVHRNRAPVSGRVFRTEHVPGRFHAAYSSAAGMENEHCRTVIGDGSSRVAVIQIAGWFARRIVCRVKPGQELALAEEFGLIRFGSANQLVFDQSWEPVVAQGDRVRAGLTVIARKKQL